MENIKYGHVLANVVILSAWLVGLALFSFAWYLVLRHAIVLTVVAPYLSG